jgi:lipopolysaccharide export system protein LptC
MMRNRGRILALLILIAVGSWWLGDDDPRDEPGPAPALTGETRTIDYRISGLDVVRMTPAGRPAHRLRAERLRHFTDDATTELTAPRLRVFQGDAPPWEVDAEQAWMSADGSLMLLTGEVVISRNAGEMTRPVRMTTSDLRVQPRQDYAETDEAVRVEREDDWLDAVGMQAWLRPPSRIKFLSEVRGRHVPN